MQSFGPPNIPGPYGVFDLTSNSEGSFGEQHAFITGITKDSNSAPLGGCTVSLFVTFGNVLYSVTKSDGSGNYKFEVAPNTNYYAVAYLAGSPDVTGATLNTLTGV